MEKQQTKKKKDAGPPSRVSSSATLSSASSRRTRVHWSSPPTGRSVVTSSTLKAIPPLASSPTTTSMSLTSRQASQVSLPTAISRGSSLSTTAASSAKAAMKPNRAFTTTTTSSGTPASSSSSGGSAENDSSSSTYLSAMPDSSSTACMASVMRNYVVRTSATSVSPLSTTTVGSFSNRQESTVSANSAASTVHGWTTMTWRSSATAIDEPLLAVATVNVRSSPYNPNFLPFPSMGFQRNENREGQHEFLPWEDTDDEVDPNAAWARVAPLTAATGDCEPAADEDLSTSPVVGKCHSAPCALGCGGERAPLMRLAEGGSALSLVQRPPQGPPTRRLLNAPPSAARGIPPSAGSPLGQMAATRQTGEPNAWPSRIPRCGFPPVASAVYRRSALQSGGQGPQVRCPPPLYSDDQRLIPRPAPQHRSYSASAGDRRSSTHRHRSSDAASQRSARSAFAASDHLKERIQPWTLMEPQPPLPAIKFQPPRPFSSVAPSAWNPNFMTTSSSDERPMSVSTHLSRRSSSQPKSYPETKGALSSRRVFTNVKFLSNKREASQDPGRRILSRSPARSLPPFTRAPSNTRKISEDLPSKMMKIEDTHSSGLAEPNSYGGTFYGRTFVGSPAWGGRVVQPSPSARRSAEASRAPRVFRRSTSAFPSASHHHSAPPFSRHASQTCFESQQSPFGSPEDPRPEPWKGGGGARDIHREAAEPFPCSNIFGIVPPNLKWDLPEEKSEDSFQEKDRRGEKEPFDFMTAEIRAMHQREHHEHNIEKSCFIFRYPYKRKDTKSEQTETPPWSTKREPETNFPFFFSAEGMDYMKKPKFMSPKENDFRSWKRQRGRSEELPLKQEIPRMKLPYTPGRTGARQSRHDILTNFGPEAYDESLSVNPFGGTEPMDFRESVDPDLFGIADQPCIGNSKRPITFDDENSFRNITDENPSPRYASQDLRLRTCKQKREWGLEASITIGQRPSDQISPTVAMKPPKALPRETALCPWPERCNIALSFSFDKFGHVERNPVALQCIEPLADGVPLESWNNASLNHDNVESFTFGKPAKTQKPFSPIPNTVIPRKNNKPNLNSWRQPFDFSPIPPRDITPQEIQLWRCHLNNEGFPFDTCSPDSFKPELYDTRTCKEIHRREAFGEVPQEYDSGADSISFDESHLVPKTTRAVEGAGEELISPNSLVWVDEPCTIGAHFGTEKSLENIITDGCPTFQQLASSSSENQLVEMNSATNLRYSELDTSLTFNENSITFNEKDGRVMGDESLVTILRDKFQDEQRGRNSWNEYHVEKQTTTEYSPSQRRHNKEPFGSFRMGDQRLNNQLDNIELWENDIKNKSLQIYEEFSSPQQRHEAISNNIKSPRKRLLYPQGLSQRKYSPPIIKSLVGPKFGASQRYCGIYDKPQDIFEDQPQISIESSIHQETFIGDPQINDKMVSFQSDALRISSADCREKHVTESHTIRTHVAPREEMSRNHFHRQMLTRALEVPQYSQPPLIQPPPVLYQMPNALPHPNHIVPFVPSALKMRLPSREETFTGEGTVKSNVDDQCRIMYPSSYLEKSEFTNEEMNISSLQGSTLQSLPRQNQDRKDSAIEGPVCTSDSVSSISIPQSLCVASASSSYDPKFVIDNHHHRYLPIRRSMKFCKQSCCHHTTLSQNIFEEEHNVSEAVDSSQQESIVQVIEPSNRSTQAAKRNASNTIVDSAVFSEQESLTMSNATENGDKQMCWFHKNPSLQQENQQHLRKENDDRRHSRNRHKSEENRRSAMECDASRMQNAAKEVKVDPGEICEIKQAKTHHPRRKVINKPWKVTHRMEEMDDVNRNVPSGDLPDEEKKSSDEKDSKDSSSNKPAWKPRTFRRRPWPRPPPGEGPFPTEQLLEGLRKPNSLRSKSNRHQVAKEANHKDSPEYATTDTEAPNPSSPFHPGHGRNILQKIHAPSLKPDHRRPASGKTISELYRSGPWVESQISLGNLPETNEPTTLPSFASKRETPTYNIVAAAVTAAVAIKANKDSIANDDSTKGSAKCDVGNQRDDNNAPPVNNQDVKNQRAISRSSVVKESSSRCSSIGKIHSRHASAKDRHALSALARASTHSRDSAASYLSARSHLAVHAEDPGDDDVASSASAPGSARDLTSDAPDANHKTESEASGQRNRNALNNTSSESVEKCIVCRIVKKGAPKKTS